MFETAHNTDPTVLQGIYLYLLYLEYTLKIFVHPPLEGFSIPGYLHGDEGRLLHLLAKLVPRNGTVVEIGSFKGKSTVFIASALRRGAQINCIDTWDGAAMPAGDQDGGYDEFLRNTAKYERRIVIHQGASNMIAASWTAQIDLLFIDGNHSYEGCSSDLEEWLPHVRPGGTVVCHDVDQRGVREAIDGPFPTRSRRFTVTVWSTLAAQTRR